MTTHVISNPHSFWLAARSQRVCAVCEHPGRFHAHHVIPKQTLRRLSRPEHDTRGALRLCDKPVNGCHMAFERAGPGKIAVPVAKWTQENVCYVWEVLGVTAVQLERKYGDLTLRFWCHTNGDCPVCQA